MKSDKKPPVVPRKPIHVKLYACQKSHDAGPECELSLKDDDILVAQSRQSDPNYLIAKLKGKPGKFSWSLVPEVIDEVPSMFHEAAKRGNTETIKRCLEYKVPINCLDVSSSTALHWAAAFGQEECVKILLESPGVEINVRNKIGDTPLHNATWKNHANIVKILIEAGADPTIVNNEGQIPLGLAVQADSKALLKKRISIISDDEYFAKNGEDENDDSD